MTVESKNTIDNIKEFEPFAKSDKLIKHYLEKLGHEEEYIETMGDILDTIETIMEHFDVREMSKQWDQQGLELKDNEVILPDGMEKIIDEIVQENLIYQYLLPEKYGGLGESGFMIGPLTERIAYYDMPLQMFIMIGFTIIEGLLLYQKPAFDEIIHEFASGERKGGYVAFTEPEAGSNLKNVKSTSEKVGDEYVLNGTKIFITNGGKSKTGFFLAKNMVDGKEKGTNVFLVDNLDNIEVLRLEEKSGIHASPTAQLRFDNVTVPEEYLISERGSGYEKVLERILGMRVGVSFQGVATAKRSFEVARDYALERKQFDKPIIQFDAVQRKLLEMRKQIDRLDEFAYRGSFGLDRYLKGWVPADIGAGGKANAEEQAAKNVPGQVRGGLAHYFASSSKIYTSEIANSMAYDALQIFGGSGFVAETEINQIYRDIRVLPIYEGTSEIHEWILDRSQQALDFVPKFERTYEQYDETTLYERYLFDRYPGLENKI